MNIKIKDAHFIHLNVPIENPIKTSFGVMDSRYAVFLYWMMNTAYRA